MSKLQLYAQFTSFDEFEACFMAWKDEEFHPMRIKHSVLHSNKEIRYFQVYYVCCHYGRPRYRGKNIRPKQNYLARGCNAKVRLQFSRKTNNLIVVFLNSEHNHPVGPRLYPWYFASHSTNPEIGVRKTTVSLIKTRKKLILRKKKCNSKNYLLQMMSRIEMRDNSCLPDEIRKSIAEDKECYNFTVQNNGIEEQLIVLATSAMKKSYINFPKVILLDGSNKILDYHLYTFLVLDTNNNVIPIAHIFVTVQQELNFPEILKYFLNAFENVERTKIFVMDKLYPEYECFNQYFPAAKIFLCLSYVLQMVKKKISEMNFSVDQQQEFVEQFELLLQSESYKYYEDQLTKIMKYSEIFSQYIKQTWDPIRHLWHLMEQLDTTQQSLSNVKRCSYSHKVKLAIHCLSLQDVIQLLLNYEKITFVDLPDYKPCFPKQKSRQHLPLETSLNCSYQNEVPVIENQISIPISVEILHNSNCDAITARPQCIITSQDKDPSITNTEKFNQVSNLCTKISTYLSNLNMEDFNEKMELLKNLLVAWKAELPITLAIVNKLAVNKLPLADGIQEYSNNFEQCTVSSPYFIDENITQAKDIKITSGLNESKQSSCSYEMQQEIEYEVSVETCLDKI